VRRSHARGNTAVMGDPQGRQYESTHDDNGNTTSQTVVGAGGVPGEKGAYDGSNNIRSFTDARGNTTTYVFRC
jgi:YD repeat-containing protein